MSRVRFIPVFVALLALASLLAACGSDEDDGSGGGAGGNPQAVIDRATLKGIESGVLDLSFAVDAEGEEGGDLDVSLSGPFQGGTGKGAKPQFDLTAEADGSLGGEDVDFEGGLVLLPNSAYVNYEGTQYEVDPSTFSFAESALKAQTGAGRSGGSPTGCQKAASRLEIGNFVDNLSNDGGADVEGTETTKVSGDLDVPGALDALLDLAEEPACKSQAEALGPLPSKAEIADAKREIGKSVKTAHLDVYVGEDDIVRQISAQVAIEPRGRSGGGPQRAEVEFDLKLAEVNEEQEISAPDDARPLNDLFFELGINPLELLGLLEGEGLSELFESVGSATARAGAAGGATQREYVKCLGEATTPVDLQRCTKLAG